MRWSQTHIPTLREDPVDAEVASHRLMLRAGLIRKLAAGIYSYLPLGQRVLLKVIAIIRQEMTRAGAQEVLLPALQPAELWKRSGRYELMGPELIRFRDRHGKETVLGPTHEEVITALVAGELRSYRQLPLNLYQIQVKFRDEPRPRFGVIRSSEFLMKDAYSFDRDATGLERSYQAMYEAYQRIFHRCGLEAIPVQAETGFMGGSDSHEFMVPAEHGEDTVVRCACGYAASHARATYAVDDVASAAHDDLQPLQVVDTPAKHTVEQVSAFLGVSPAQLVKTLIYLADGRPVAALVRGDHEVNEAKLQKLLQCQALRMADAATIERLTGAPIGFSGPVGLKGVALMADHAVVAQRNMVVGANQPERHAIAVNVPRDFKPDQVADIRYVVTGDRCPQCRGPIALEPAIEVGHIFKLGARYTQALNATFLDEDGVQKPLVMGCYGIGVTRIIPTVIERHHDEAGIRWPSAIAPYLVDLVPLNIRHAPSREAAEQLYRALTDAGVDAILDDRDERAGVKLKDADLIGFPLRVVISEKTVSASQVEVRVRATGATTFLPLAEAPQRLSRLIAF